MNRESKLFKNTLILAIGTFFPKLAIFIALPILTSQLSKVDYGIYDLVITLVSLLLPVVTVQIQSAAFRYLIDVRNDKKRQELIITNIYIFVVITSLICLIVVFIILGKQPLSVRVGICLYYFFDIIAIVNRQIIRGMSKNVDYAISSIISGLGQIFFIYLIVLGLHKGLAGALFALAAAEFFSTMFLLIKVRILSYVKLKYLSRRVLKEMLFYSWPMVPNSLSQWVIHASDRLVITGVLGIEANAVYSVAYKIPSILSLAQTTFNMAWQENASIFASDDDVAEYYTSMFQVLFDIVSGMMSILIGFTPLLFALFIRGDYQEAYFQMPILFMGMFFLCMSTFWGGIFVAIKQTKAVGITTVIAAAINLFIDVCTVKWIGLYAGSISSVTAYVVMCLLRALSIKKYITIKYNLRHIIFILLVLVCQCILCFLQNSIFNILNFIGGIIVCLWLNKKTIFLLLKQ